MDVLDRPEHVALDMRARGTRAELDRLEEDEEEMRRANREVQQMQQRRRQMRRRQRVQRRQLRQRQVCELVIIGGGGRHRGRCERLLLGRRGRGGREGIGQGVVESWSDPMEGVDSDDHLAQQHLARILECNVQLFDLGLQHLDSTWSDSTRSCHRASSGSSRRRWRLATGGRHQELPRQVELASPLVEVDSALHQLNAECRVALLAGRVRCGGVLVPQDCAPLVALEQSLARRRPATISRQLEQLKCAGGRGRERRVDEITTMLVLV